jgi:hypothetical protein
LTKLDITHCFNPVGQGLFVSGSISLDRVGGRSYQGVGRGAVTTPKAQFRWVYDCGTSKGKHSLRRSIKRLANLWHGEKIDLLTLSHFHTDHISGIVQLLKAIEARTLMLPWAPLWKRIAIGFAQGLRADDPLMGFFIDPVTFLSGEVPDRFQSVLFVMPSTGPGPSYEADPPTDPEPGFDEDGLGKAQDWGEPGDPDDLELSGRGGANTRTLGQGRKIQFGWWWEFIPYNDPETSPSDLVGFRAIVGAYREVLLNGVSAARKDALRDLRRFYETTFPGHSAMNDVSLVLYGGAMGRWQGQIYCDCHSIWGLLGGECHCWKRHESRAAIMLTGDGNLSSVTKWANLESYLTAKRAKQTSVFQVAHHGARANWHEGLATLVAPVTSVFSSDPTHKHGHPHAEVLRDFWPFRPVQVDQHAGFSTHIVLVR